MTPRASITVTCACGRTFETTARNAASCPECRRVKYRNCQERFVASRRKRHDEDGEEFEPLDPIDTEIAFRPWVLIQAPPDCDFKPGAKFTALDLTPEMYKRWVEPGMIFESGRGGTKQVRRF